MDLRHVVRRSTHVVLDQAAALEHCDVGHALVNVNAHQVTPDRTALALFAAAPLERGLVELERCVVGDDRLDGLGGASAFLLLLLLAIVLLLPLAI